MEHALQLSLLDRLMLHRAGGSTDASAAACAYTASIYVDPAQLAAERATVFGKLPQLVGFSGQLARAGDYFTHDLSGRPLVVCRQADGSLAAYLNICRHRGARVAAGPTGHAETGFVCPYHAWRYGPDGSLQNIPCAQYFKEVDRSAHGLRRVVVGEHEGLIFAVPDPSVEHFDLAQGLGAFGEQFASFGLGRRVLFRTTALRARANWKIMIEANRESYHIPVLHGAGGGARYRPQLSLQDNQGPHSRIVLPYRQISARTLGEQRERWQLLGHADVVYSLFPSTLVMFSRTAVHVLTVFPTAPGECVVHGGTLVEPEELASFNPEFHEAYWNTIGEDIAVAEAVQRSAEADPEMRYWLGANEALLADFHSAVRQSVEGAPSWH